MLNPSPALADELTMTYFSFRHLVVVFSFFFYVNIPPIPRVPSLHNLNGILVLSFASLDKFLPAYVTIHDYLLP